jgi:hypothetical protein
MPTTCFQLERRTLLNRADESQMSALERRFNPLSIEQVREFAAEGRQLSARSVAVALDDGFADNYDVVLPILSRHSIPATFYIPVNAVETGRPPWHCRFNFAFSKTMGKESGYRKHNACPYSNMMGVDTVDHIVAEGTEIVIGNS